MGFKFFTHVCNCSVKTELIGRNNDAKNSFNLWIIRSKVNRQFSVSFAFESTPGQWSRCTENRMSAFCEFQQHLVRDMIPDSLWTILFHRMSLLFGTWSNKRPLSNTKFFASMETTLDFATHSSSLPLLSQAMSLNIDIKRILPVKVSGVCPKSLSRSVTLPPSCNVVNPGKMFHSNSVDSPLIAS